MENGFKAYALNPLFLVRSDLNCAFKYSSSRTFHDDRRISIAIPGAGHDAAKNMDIYSVVCETV